MGPLFKLHGGFWGSLLVGEDRQWMRTALVCFGAGRSRLCSAQPDISRKDLGAGTNHPLMASADKNLRSGTKGPKAMLKYEPKKIKINCSE